MEDHTGIRRTRSATSELVYRIRARIREQELLPGEKLGSERALADSLGVSRSDLRNALTVLESDHEIIRKIGRAGGIVISDGRLERNINTVESLPTIARRQGMRVSSKVLQAVIAPASVSDVRLLRLPGEHPMIYDITRLRYIENRPLSLERSHLPAYLFPLFLTRDLTTPFYTMFVQCRRNIGIGGRRRAGERAAADRGGNSADAHSPDRLCVGWTPVRACH